ncbi:MAG TPA: methylated-DNA--[protein]-cysteine S-methyltransferase [Candidatus Binataceae bacterium]|nr:methylated-DNA--[protein]-cysteine S-methyltransferase [Candidatus Binataceae bacterium]
MDDLREIEEYIEDAAATVDGAAVTELLATVHSRLHRALDRIARPAARIGLIESSVGRLFMAESDRGLLGVRYADTGDDSAMLNAIRQKFDLREDKAAAGRIRDQIERALAGDTDAVANHPVDLSLVTSPFQRRAYVRLRQVPAGGVVTYQALAAAIGAPSGQRAVGHAMATNPLPIFVPCHRVIKSDGSIGNYGGGVERKLKLLRAEGFSIGKGNRVPSEAVYGHWQSHIFCRPDCSAVLRADRKKWIIFTDSDRARLSGMRPCKLCRPAAA